MIMHAYEKVSQARTAVVPKVQNSGGLRSRFCNTNEGGAGVVACHAAESIFKPSSMIPLIDIAIYIPTHAEHFTLSECKTAARTRAPDTV